MEKGKPVDKYLGAAQGVEGSEAPDPEMIKQVEQYNSVLMNLLHSEKTRDNVISMLESGNGDMFTSVPQAAVSVNDMGINLMEQSGATPQLGVQLGAASYLIGDLIELGMAKGLWERPNEDDILAVTEDTLQIVIERGLADGSIDPIQLQLETEPLMSDNQRAAGTELMMQTGTPAEPNQNAIIEQYATQKAAKGKQRQAERIVQRQQAIKQNEVVGRTA